MASLYVAWSVLTLSLLSGQVHGGQLISYKAEAFLDPIRNYTACGRASESWVCDPGRYLTKGQGDELNRIAGTLNGISTVGGGPAVMIAVVPRIINPDGNPAASLAGISNFTSYLRSVSWSQFSPSLIVIVYHIARNEIWMDRGNVNSISVSCICQVTYESRRFFSEKEFHIALNIFTRKFVDVINGDSTCSATTDNVPWMVNSVGQCTWDAELIVNGVKPLTGLPEGGGIMNVTGDNLGAAPAVQIGSEICDLITSPSNNKMTCVIPSLPSTAQLNIPIPVYLLIIGNVRYDTGWRFVYTKPTLTTLRPLTTIVSGGLDLTVEGNNLDLVTMAIMIVTLRGKETGRMRTYSTQCQIQSATYMLCPTPKLDLEDVRTRKKKRDVLSAMFETVKHRVFRATTDESVKVEDVEITAEILLNGEMVQLEEFRDRPAMLQTYEDPMLHTFVGQDKTVTFVSVWPKSERTIDIKGDRLLPALLGHQLNVLIGGGRCQGVEIYSNQLICRPPVTKPAANATNPDVLANVGNLEFSIGYLKYIDNFWDYLPLRYGIIGAGAALLLIILIIIIACCCCSKSHR